jgi:hypothetical protein
MEIYLKKFKCLICIWEQRSITVQKYQHCEGEKRTQIYIKGVLDPPGIFHKKLKIKLQKNSKMSVSPPPPPTPTTPLEFGENHGPSKNPIILETFPYNFNPCVEMGRAAYYQVAFSSYLLTKIGL